MAMRPPLPPFPLLYGGCCDATSPPIPPETSSVPLPLIDVVEMRIDPPLAPPHLEHAFSPFSPRMLITPSTYAFVAVR